MARWAASVGGHRRHSEEAAFWSLSTDVTAYTDVIRNPRYTIGFLNSNEMEFANILFEFYCLSRVAVWISPFCLSLKLICVM